MNTAFAGPAFGGATGLLFYICYVINSAFNATAMVEDIMQTFLPDAPAIYFTYMYHSTLFVLLLVALAGAEIFAKVNSFLAVALTICIFIALGSIVFGQTRVLETLSANGTDSCYAADADLPQEPYNITYYKPSVQNFNANFHPDGFDKIDNLKTVLGLVYATLNPRCYLAT